MNKIEITNKDLNELFTGLANMMLTYEGDHFETGTALDSKEELIILSDVVMPMERFKALLNIWGKIRPNYINNRIDDKIEE